MIRARSVGFIFQAFNFWMHSQWKKIFVPARLIRGGQERGGSSVPRILTPQVIRAEAHYHDIVSGESSE